MAEIDSSVIDAITASMVDGLGEAHKKKTEIEVEVEEFTLETGKTAYTSLFGSSFSGRDHNLTTFDKSAWEESPLKLYMAYINANYIFQPEACEKLAVAIEHGDTVLFTGPTGSGKSTLVEQFCAKTNRPFIRINMTGDMECAQFFGQLVVEDGATVWRDGMFTTGYRHGAVILIDEWELCPPEIMMGLQRVLEDNGKLVLKEKPGGEVIEPHPETRIIMGGNTLGQGDETGAHAGTNVQNTATIDRFQTVIKLDYLDAVHEVSLIMKSYPKISESIAEKMVQFAKNMRIANRNGHVTLTVSPRTLLNWAAKIVYWGDPITALKMAYFDKIADSEKKEVNELIKKSFGKQIKTA